MPRVLLVLLLRTELEPLFIADDSLSYNVAAAKANTGSLGTLNTVGGYGQGHEWGL